MLSATPHPTSQRYSCDAGEQQRCGQQSPRRERRCRCRRTRARPDLTRQIAAHQRVGARSVAADAVGAEAGATLRRGGAGTALRDGGAGGGRCQGDGRCSGMGCCVRYGRSQGGGRGARRGRRYGRRERRRADGLTPLNRLASQHVLAIWAARGGDGVTLAGSPNTDRCASAHVTVEN